MDAALKREYRYWAWRTLHVERKLALIIYIDDAMVPFAASRCGARDRFSTPRAWERCLDKHDLT